ncbi:MAG: insulinase family protein [Deltaproteobacteria bacterium]|nr:insulinase family protein [Deltaproteobacteria bacterium]
MKIFIPLIVMAACLLLQPATRPGVHAFPLGEHLEQFQLPNGLTVLLLERRISPTISFTMSFRTGAVDEDTGATGVAHMLEHMLFKGTRTIGTRDYKAEKKLLERIDAVAIQLDDERRKGSAGDAARIEALARDLTGLQEQANALIVENEFDTIYTRNGAEGMNARTGYDMTTYTVSLPANRLELWLRLESERFAEPVFRQYYAERDVVIEEMRQSYETQPDRLLATQLLTTAFQAHPYGRPAIGWEADIKFLPRAACEDFFKRRYCLANAVVAVVGAVDIQEASRLFDRYFTSISAGSVEKPFITQEPPQRGERRTELHFEAEPQLMIGFHKPSCPDRADYAFELLGAILSSGRTSRLYQSLVMDRPMAASVDAFNGFPGSRYPNLFVIKAAPLKGVACSDVEKGIYAEIDKLARMPLPAEELAKAKKQFRADFVRNLDSNRMLSRMLAYYQVLCGDWRYLEKNLKIIESISAQEIQSAIQKYLVSSNRTVAVLVKEKK